jgi:isocitrate lyase
MGYKFQFVTLAGFHALNLSMFELARQYKQTGMTAYSALQEKEFASEREHGYLAAKHQRFVGTGYFDQVQQVISGGLASTVALADSTETEQFSAGGTPTGRAQKKPAAGAPGKPFPEMPQEEMLQPSGD